MNLALRRFETQAPRQAMAKAQGMMQDVFGNAQSSISANPSTAVFTAFAAGMGLGIGLALVSAAVRHPLPECVNSSRNSSMNTCPPGRGPPEIVRISDD